jgi:hypothetical protein
MVRNQGRVTRFVVMAMLQAARARSLGLSEEAAYSWGLNRAIFYAAAKRGFRATPPDTGGSLEGEPERPSDEFYRLGDEGAYRDPTVKKLIFTIGDEKQSLDEFERSVSSRFGTKDHFRTAWEEALRFIDAFDRTALESRRRFYDEVYRPRRDQLSDAWSERFSPKPQPKR